MLKLISNYKVLLFFYGCAIVAIGFFFLALDNSLLHEVHFDLPLLFLIRFSVYWMMCLVIAVSGYLFYLSSRQLVMPRPDRVYAARLGKLALYVGVTGSTIAFVCFLTLRHYPF